MRPKRIVAPPALPGAETESGPDKPPAKRKRRALPADWRDHAARLETQMQARPANKPARGSDADDLPPELLRELSAGRADALGAQIVVVFENYGGSADLDQVLIGLYRAFHVVHKRRVIQNKVWQMIRKGHLAKVKGARGFFCLPSRRPAAAGRRRKRA